MTRIRYALFDTPIGACAVAWGEHGLVAVQLPEPTEAASRARLTRRLAGAEEAEPPEPVQAVIARIRALLSGAPDDLADVALELERVPEFNRKVYAIARAVPPGQTRTYGEIAKLLGDDPRLARDVGEAMGKNPWPIVVPCHRVVAAGGKLGGFSAAGGANTKQRMLEIEGAAIVAPREPARSPQGDLFG